MKIITEKKDGILYVDFNSPSLNILNLEIFNELIEVLESEKTSQVIAFKGTGKLFSAGVEVKEHLPETMHQMIGVFSKVIIKLFEFPGITAAIVKGGAYGGGCEIALCCDIVLADKEALFSQPEIKLGVFPPVACALYPLLFPSKIVNYLIYSGENILASALENYGIINKTFEKDTLYDEAHRYLSKFTELSLPVIQFSKKATNMDSLIKERLERANTIYLNELMNTEDARDGLSAFLERKKHVWKHR